MENFDSHATNADVRDDVQERYAAGAQAVEAALCCPVDYNPQYLKIIPVSYTHLTLPTTPYV